MSETLKIAKTPRSSQTPRPLCLTDYRSFFATVEFIVKTAFKISETNACKDVQIELMATAARLLREKAAEFEEKERSARTLRDASE